MKTKIMSAAIAVAATLAVPACSVQTEQPTPHSVRMVRSEIQRMPDASMIDFNTALKWNYTHGLELQSFILAARQHPELEQEVWDYVTAYLDTIITADGQIRKYKLSNFTLDHINPGKMLMLAYDRTGDQRLRIAMDTLYKQLSLHPRVSEGGFWHKKAYPWQMWLDGVYMEAPYYAEYALRFLSDDEQRAAWDDITRQFSVCYAHTYDAANGLLRHAWDESREQQWADQTTGQAPHVWGRALGWYCMALVDCLGIMPADYEGRQVLLDQLNALAPALAKVEDETTGAWWQVLDQVGREGNYLETSCTAMFAYTFMKGALNGWLPREYWDRGYKALDGLNKNFVREDSNGTISLTRVCGVAGLGGTPYRDGSFEYYVGEIIRDNDPKGVGPYIFASLLAEAYGKDMNAGH